MQISPEIVPCLSWQVVPRKMVDWFGEPDAKTERVMHEGDAADGQARHRRARAGLPRLNT
jgi:hypothetical protein